MKTDNQSSPVLEILRIYGRGLKKTGYLILFLAGIAAAGAAAVLPIWYLASHYKKLFSILSLGLLAAGIVYLLIRKFIAVNRTRRQTGKRGSAVRTLITIVSIVIFIFWIYFDILLFLRGTIPAGIITAFVFLIAFGIYLYARKKTASS